MTSRSRHLVGLNSPPPLQSPKDNLSLPKMEIYLDSDFVVILVALLCALICVVGLVTIVRFAWVRRMVGAPRAAAANRGLKKKVLQSLPKLTYGEDDEQTTKLSDCAICLAEFAAGEKVRVLPHCGHGFHVACIDTWLRSHSTCPSCRQILGAARCQKCLRLAEATCSGVRPQPEPRESHVNTFLP